MIWCGTRFLRWVIQWSAIADVSTDRERGFAEYLSVIGLNHPDSFGSRFAECNPADESV